MRAAGLIGAQDPKGIPMCRAAKCKVCGKTSWAGCGMHVDAVKKTVPAAQWCDGHSPAEKAAVTAPAAKRSWFRRNTKV